VLPGNDAYDREPFASPKNGCVSLILNSAGSLPSAEISQSINFPRSYFAASILASSDWPKIMLAQSPGRPRPRKEWNAVHPGDRIGTHSANGRSVPNGCCPTDSLLIVQADPRLW